MSRKIKGRREHGPQASPVTADAEKLEAELAAVVSGYDQGATNAADDDADDTVDADEVEAEPVNGNAYLGDLSDVVVDVVLVDVVDPAPVYLQELPIERTFRGKPIDLGYSTARAPEVVPVEVPATLACRIHGQVEPVKAGRTNQLTIGATVRTWYRFRCPRCDAPRFTSVDTPLAEASDARR